MPKPPHKIRITAKVSYEVLYHDFQDDTFGECRFDTKQIVIQRGLSRSQFLQTLVHEILHAIEEEYGVPISHRLIYDLELPIISLLKLNKWRPFR